MKKWIECVPNFSEGRDSAFLSAITHAVTNDTDTEIWDKSSDSYHNRSVFTIAGEPESLETSVMQFVKEASQRINMNTHQGVHPCIGATDVIPFIPLKNTMMQDCIDLADRLGKRISDEYNIPVYLYAHAARKQSHFRLADLRRGGYLTLAQEIRDHTKRFPDYGPNLLGSAGATCIGARDVLIAFNIFLDTQDVAYAKIIAKIIRESSGGFIGIQAIGLSVNGLAQVSINVTNYRVTPLSTVYHQVEKLADNYSICVAYSELIGLLPQDALSDITPEQIKLINFSESRIIESHF